MRGEKLRSDDPDERRTAASVLGSARSARKAEASRANGRLSPGEGRPVKPLAEFECTCGAGDAIEGHPTTCPRGRAIRRRKAAGKL